MSRNIETEHIEQHLEKIYNCLQNPALDKLNILNYFETIIQCSNVANRLINSVFVNLLVKITKNCKQTMIKIRLCSIIGLLIRHATVIEPEVAGVGISNLMIDLIKDVNEKVKRRAMAALGEYLFYSAT